MTILFSSDKKSVLLTHTLSTLKRQLGIEWDIEDIDILALYMDAVTGTARIVADMVNSTTNSHLRVYVYNDKDIYGNLINREQFISNDFAATTHMFTHTSSLNPMEFSSIRTYILLHNLLTPDVVPVLPPCGIGTLYVQEFAMQYTNLPVIAGTFIPPDTAFAAGLYIEDTLHLLASPSAGGLNTEVTKIVFSAPGYNADLPGTSPSTAGYSARSICTSGTRIFSRSQTGGVVNHFDSVTNASGTLSIPSGTVNLVRTTPSGSIIAVNDASGEFRLHAWTSNLTADPISLGGVTPDGTPEDAFATDEFAYVCTNRAIYRVDITNTANRGQIISISGDWLHPFQGYGGVTATARRMTLLSTGNIFVLLKNSGSNVYGILISPTGTILSSGVLPGGVSRFQRALELPNGNVLIMQANVHGPAAIEIVPTAIGTTHVYGAGQLTHLNNNVALIHPESQAFLNLNGEVWFPGAVNGYIPTLTLCDNVPPLTAEMITAIKSPTRNYK